MVSGGFQDWLTLLKFLEVFGYARMCSSALRCRMRANVFGSIRMHWMHSDVSGCLWKYSYVCYTSQMGKSLSDVCWSSQLGVIGLVCTCAMLPFCRCVYVFETDLCTVFKATVNRKFWTSVRSFLVHFRFPSLSFRTLWLLRFTGWGSIESFENMICGTPT